MSGPATFVDWWKGLPIPWLVGGTVGQAEATANGQILDGQVALLKAAGMAGMPESCPSDALDHIGADRGILRGPTESDLNYAKRLKFAWSTWSRAGQWISVLEALYWGGWGIANIVQQNGLYYTLSGNPTAGQDPSSLLVVGNTMTLGLDLTSIVNPPTTSSAGYSVPAGNPWWSFDGDPQHCNRFAVIFAGTLPLQFRTYGTATFTGVEDGSVAHPWPKAVWSTPFPTDTYSVDITHVTVTDGSVGVICNPVLSSRTPNDVQVSSSFPFSGSAECLAYFSSAFADIHGSDANRMQKAIKTWRPAKAWCMGVWAIEGNAWDWPPTRTWDDGTTWDSGTSVQIMDEF